MSRPFASRVVVLAVLVLAAAAPATADPLDDLARDFWHWRAVHQPSSADDIPRIERPDGWLPDWSPAAVAARRAAVSLFEQRYGAIDASTWPIPRQVDHRAIGSAIARVRWELDVAPAWRRDPAFYIQQALGPVFDLLLPHAPFDQARARAVVQRLKQVPVTLAHATANLDDARQPFAMLAIGTLDGIAGRLATMTTALDPQLPASERGTVTGPAAAAGQALERFRGWLQDRAPRMSADIAVGREPYTWFLREVALVPFTPDELLAMGAQEWQRAVTFEALEQARNAGLPPLPIAASAEAQIAQEAKDEAAIRRFLDDKQLLTVPASTRHYLNALIPPYLVPLAFLGVTDDLTSATRLADDGYSYIRAPRPDLPYFYLSTARDPRPIIVHEGVPGHHFQMTLAWRHENPIRRQYYDSGANEGIGFYAEEMLLQAGLWDDSPRSREIVYNFMRLRALRVEVDVKLATGMFTIPQAAEYLEKTVPMDHETALEEAASFAASPGQAITYQIGKIQIVRMLADARRAQGPAFSLRAFHDFVWKNGNLPLALLRWELLQDRSEIERLAVIKVKPRLRHEPYIPDSASLPEMTPLPLAVGTLLGVIFGASSLYLVLKVGLTVSASIPVAVISIALFRAWSKVSGRDATILEHNLVQTAGSAGESIAFGLGSTMPAIMILGFDLEITRVALVGVLGGLLGILMMIPLRRALIVEQHGLLKYPEGTACAEVLKAGASAESRAAASAAARREEAARGGAATSAAAIFSGFAIGLVYKTLNVVFRLWKDIPEKVFGAPFAGGSVSAEISPELLGVGYIIGPYIGSLMCAGGVLAYLVLIPAIKFFGGGLAAPLAPGTMPIADMTPDDVRGAYVLYIGAGAVAAGGIVSLVRALPTIWASLRAGIDDARGGAASRVSLARTDRDLPMSVVAGGSIALVLVIMLATPLHMNVLGASLIVVLGFLFTTVSSRLTGEVGSSSNPISGMTVATLLITCLAFLLVGWVGPTYYVTALSVGAIVCIACSNGGTTSQDLKTGFLVGATPRHQQVAILVGSLTSALLLGPILLQLNESATVYVPAVVAGVQTFPPSMHVDPATLTGRQVHDGREYRVWFRQDAEGGPAGKYLVDDAGTPVFLVDPGINGVHRTTPDGRPVMKFDAPKATLMSYIIKGILNRQLPWALVLLGVMITLVLEMSAIPSLAFAVGVYLPLSTSTPIFVGGMVRWLADRYIRRKHAATPLTEEELVAEGDRSPGVLLASGYIAGGALAGIGIAFAAGLMDEFTARIGAWADSSNPLVGGPNANLLSLVPFAGLCVILYLVARELLLAPGKQG